MLLMLGTEGKYIRDTNNIIYTYKIWAYCRDAVGLFFIQRIIDMYDYSLFQLLGIGETKSAKGIKPGEVYVREEHIGADTGADRNCEMRR